MMNHLGCVAACCLRGQCNVCQPQGTRQWARRIALPNIYGGQCSTQRQRRQMNNRRAQKVQHDAATIETLKSCCIQLGARQRTAMHSPHTHPRVCVCVCVSLECEYPHSFITYSPHPIPQPHPTTKCPIPPASLLMEPVSPSPTAGQHFVPCPFPLSLFPFPYIPCPLSPITIGERRLGPCDQRTNCCDLTASFSDIFAHFLFFKGAPRFAFLWLWLWLCF